MEATESYNIFLVGDSVATIDFGNLIDEQINKKVIRLFKHLREHPFDGMIEAIPAYSSLSIYFDFVYLRKRISHQKKVYGWVRNELHRIMRNSIDNVDPPMNVVRIPVCYDREFGHDLDFIAEEKNLSKEEIVRSHLSKQYRVYMLGFLPGFAYLGEVDEQIAIARKPQPQAISAGSVGIAGRQTGIYPLNSPGGWQIIGRTPQRMFNKDKERSCVLEAGDYVEFFSITRDEFENYQAGSI